MIVWLFGAYFHATFLYITCISNDTSYKFDTINNSCSAIVVAFAPFAACEGHTRAHTLATSTLINFLFCSLYLCLSRVRAPTPDL